MEIGRRSASEIAYLSFRGDFDESQVSRAREQVGAVVEGGLRRVVFNFAAVSAIEAVPLEFVLDVHHQLRRVRGELVVSEPSNVARVALERAGMSPFLRVVSDDAAAQAHFERVAAKKMPRTPSRPDEFGVSSDGGLKVSLDVIEDVHILGWWGDLDAPGLPSVRAGIETLMARGARNLVLNLKRLRFMNSSALGFVIQTQTRLRQQGGELVVSEPSSFFLEMIGALGIERSFPVVSSNTDGLKYFRERSGPARSALEITSHHAKRLGSTRIEFQLLDAPEITGVGKLLYIGEEGPVFAYPDETQTRAIPEAELVVRRGLRVRIPLPVPGWFRDLEMDGEIAKARRIEDDPFDAVMYELRYTRIDPDDRAILDRLREGADQSGPVADDEEG
ncbi:MAG: STAS domain-containing protein [Planctomycetota bacterium]|jgi:anti-anti-sigma factor